MRWGERVDRLKMATGKSSEGLESSSVSAGLECMLVLQRWFF